MRKKLPWMIIILFSISITIGGCSPKTKKIEENKKIIKFATFYPDKDKGEIYKEIAKEFEKINKNIKVEVTTDFGEDSKIRTAVTDKYQYDIIGIKRNLVIEFAKSGLIKDISDIIKENRLDKNLYKISLAYGNYNGKSYGIGDMPMSMEWFYNTGIFERNKLAEPANLKELQALIRKLNNKKFIPIDIGAIDGWTLNSFFGMIACQTTNVNEFVADYGTDSKSYGRITGMNTAFEIFGKLAGSGIKKNSDEINYKQSILDFVNGKAAILPAWSYTVDQIDKSKSSGFKYNVFKNNVALTASPISLYSASAGQVISIPSNSKNAKEASMFIKYLFSEEGQKKFAEKGYTTPLISGNNAENDVKKQILNHIEAADNNSMTIVDNIEPTMLQSLTMVLKDILQGRTKPKDAWNRVIKSTFQQ
jgi:ABC-type glycerol-3-phosphate transport system substrate-binding protein